MRKRTAMILIICFHLFALPAVFVACPEAAGALFACSFYFSAIWGCVRGVKRWSAKRSSAHGGGDGEASVRRWRDSCDSELWSDPAYSWIPGNFYHNESMDNGGFNQTDWTTDPSYSFMAGNIYHHDQ